MRLRLTIGLLLAGLIAAIACGGSDSTPLLRTVITPTAQQVPAGSGGQLQPGRTPAPGAGNSARSTATARPGTAQYVPSQPVSKQGVRVAFFGDQGLGPDSVAVMRLVKDEGADFLIHLGDFDYNDDPVSWERQIDQVLGPNYPYFAVVGNHDEKEWGAYQQRLLARLSRISGATCSGDYGVNSACTYRGLFFVLSGVGTLGSGHAAYLQQQLAANDAVWSICAWHKNQTALQPGGKDNDVGWDAYDICREGGAIIATGHEHSYSRTKTLTSMRNQAVDPNWPDPKAVVAGGGSSFAFVSGLGGASIRDQERCRPVTPPYGCKQEWASIYTSHQNATFGALFIDFGVDGDPRKARGYFKNIRGEIVDEFTIVSR